MTLSADYLRIRGLLEFGGVPKRSTGADCKSAGYAFVGSNPTPSTIVLVGQGVVGNTFMPCWYDFNLELVHR